MTTALKYLLMLAVLLGVGALMGLYKWWVLRRPAAEPRPVSDQPAPPGGFRRAELEAKAAEYARGLGRKVYWMVVGPVLVGIPALMAIDEITRKPDEPPSFAGLFILLGIIGVLAAAHLVMATRLARRLGLVCSACQSAFVTGRHRHPIDVVLETGKCPGCGKQLLDEAEVGPA